MEESVLQTSGLSAGTIVVILIIYRLLKSIEGKRFVSRCCGKKAEVGFEIKNMETPPPANSIAIDIKNPIHKQNDETPVHSQQ